MTTRESASMVKGIARNPANQGITVVTFNLRGVGKSTGCPFLTGFSELVVYVSVARSTGDHVDKVVGYVSIGYPFGWTTSILFGRHRKAILQSPKPILFIIGINDRFTSVKQLANKIKTTAAPA